MMKWIGVYCYKKISLLLQCCYFKYFSFPYLVCDFYKIFFDISYCIVYKVSSFFFARHLSVYNLVSNFLPIYSRNFNMGNLGTIHEWERRHTEEQIHRRCLYFLAVPRSSTYANSIRRKKMATDKIERSLFTSIFIRVKRYLPPYLMIRLRYWCTFRLSLVLLWLVCNANYNCVWMIVWWRSTNLSHLCSKHKTCVLCLNFLSSMSIWKIDSLIARGDSLKNETSYKIEVNMTYRSDIRYLSCSVFLRIWRHHKKIYGQY